MEKEFVSYKIAKKLHKLGFRESCFNGWNTDLKISYQAPLKQQVFRWFRENYELYYHIFPLQITASDKTGYRYSWEIYNHTPEWIANDEELLGSLTYEEAENACIDKLIELAKQHNNEQSIV